MESPIEWRAPCCWPVWSEADRADRSSSYWRSLRDHGHAPECGRPVCMRVLATGEREASPYCAEHHRRGHVTLAELRAQRQAA